MPLRHRAVRLLWGAAVVSDIGTWVQLIVVGSLIAANTGSAMKTGLVALATFMPQGLTAPLGGVLADRYDRRKVFAACLLAQALATSVLAAVLHAGVRSSWVLTGIILLAGSAGATGGPAYAAMQPDLVPEEELMAMVSLGAYSWNGGRVAGPLLGSVLAFWVGPAGTVAFNAATFLVMATAVTILRRPFPPHDVEGDTSLRERLRTGFRALKTTPGCRFGVVSLILINLTVVPFMGLIPIYVRSEFSGGTRATGFTASAQGVGAIIGGIVVTYLASRFGRSQVLVRLVGAVALVFVGYALAPTLGWLGPATALMGAGASSAFIMVTSIVQRDAPPGQRGRVVALMQASSGSSYGFGLLIIGGLGDLFDLRVAFATGAVLWVVTFAVLIARTPNWRAAVDGVIAEPRAALVADRA